ncbi:MATE family efflux transporter [Romeria aff. gracilis LEGE 07310]|uniref:MATE family efflux transporter n=1 Tax=Vasconcelosia minhoensis LEGE 07310 TaxID=915328 RepID=A0A8J7AUK2_9CYAN|nr:MATE family efflux transporter [Romeria gracilis]MBE9077028.1 MATE family efflux transporter [Romeria aff. gracilis LEGE 07310]
MANQPSPPANPPANPLTSLHNTNWVAPFLRLSIANTISNLMVPLAGLIDTAFLGHLDEIYYFAGVALATIIFNVIYWSFGFLRMGTTGLVAQAVGRAESDSLWLVGMRNLLLALGLGLLIFLLQLPIRRLGFSLLQADADVLTAGQAFYRACIWGAPAVLMNYVLLGWFLGRGQGRIVILLSLVSNGANVALDYGFIYRLGWASYGAGLATAMSQYLMLLVGLAMILPTIPWPTIRQLRGQLWETKAIRALFQLNRDILIRTFALVMCFSLFTNFSSGMGAQTLAVNTLLLQVVTLAAYLLDGIAFATETYAGQFYGQAAYAQLRRLVLWGSAVSVILGVGFAIAFARYPASLFGLLTNHADLVAGVKAYVIWLLPVLGFGAIAFMLDGYFLGLTAGRALRNSTLIASLICFLPIALIAQQLRSPNLLWLAMTCFMAGRALTLAWMTPKTLGPQPEPRA